MWVLKQYGQPNNSNSKNWNHRDLLLEMQSRVPCPILKHPVSRRLGLHCTKCVSDSFHFYFWRYAVHGAFGLTVTMQSLCTSVLVTETGSPLQYQSFCLSTRHVQWQCRGFRAFSIFSLWTAKGIRICLHTQIFQNNNNKLYMETFLVLPHDLESGSINNCE